ncbi:uncharacterized protein LOC129612965 [Condylostylus longicornis]|uniref:uncharacterized protein LOC129612965 n=1 Tax=Condylostylus longicornis TaxID=2530218 RepID=UPI00244E5499|nr:uncharacterized protein LOC129612965 [Condylostylus longicornis]
MQNFLLASCIFAIALAAPQYNYNVPQYGGISSGSSFSSASSGSFGGSSGGSFGGSFGGGEIGNVHAFNSFNPAPALPSASSVAATYKTRPQHQRRILPPIVSKSVYYHAAPEEPDEEIYEDNSTQQERKHYNVVFIKAPHQSVKTIATQTAQALNEEKTAIYVLSKKNDISEVRQAIADVPHHPNKPEVFFVKYKTPEEAEHAQQTIQSQYDILGGSTHVSNEGYAPVSSVIGAFGGGFNGNVGLSGGHGGFSVSSGGGNFIGSSSLYANSVAASYLPPNKVLGGTIIKLCYRDKDMKAIRTQKIKNSFRLVVQINIDAQNAAINLPSNSVL